VDPGDCRVWVERVDLDAGPGARDVRLARVWDGRAWAWADDARVVEGRLFRPGRTAAPWVAGASYEGQRYELDATGMVVARLGPEGRTEIERDGGRFVGMRRGPSWVRLDADRSGAASSDGGRARYTGEERRPDGVTDGDGVRSTYTYDAEGALASVSWPDGARVSVGPGSVTGTPGTWRCRRSGDRAALDTPEGTWEWREEGDGITLVDPARASWRTRVAAGRVMGWSAPGRAEVRLRRDPEGRVVELVDADRQTWSLGWDRGRLVSLGGTGGRVWRFQRDGEGRLTALTDPAGRITRRALDEQGRVRSVSLGAGTSPRSWDAAGRLEAEGGATLGFRLRRDARGRVTELLDPADRAWHFVRDAAGRVTELRDPAGASWSFRWDRIGRVLGVTDPRGRRVEVERRTDGRITTVLVDGRQRWELARGAAGRITGLREALGRRWGWTRDPLGRVVGVVRGDGGWLAVDRDDAGEIVTVGEIRVDRDAVGRPTGLRRTGSALGWERDLSGAVRRIVGNGIAIELERDTSGRLRAVRVGSEAWTLSRDAAGRVVAVEGPGAVRIGRDGAGRVERLEREGRLLRVDRDLRGLPTRVRTEDAEWVFRRDIVGRLLGVVAPGGLTFGVDRDASGRPTLLRFADGWLARLIHEPTGVQLRLQDGDGSPAGVAGWSADPTGEPARRLADADWTLHRDPNGTLAVAESAAGAWSLSPDLIEGPGFRLELGADGRPARAVLPPEAPPAWDTRGELLYRVGTAGELVAVGTNELVHDFAGRLRAWGPHLVERDALGRLTRVGGVEVEGWAGLLRTGDEVRATIPGLGQARRGGGLLYDPWGTPLAAVHLGPVSVAPTGLPLTAAVAEVGAGDRYQGSGGWPLLDRLDAVDPVSGQVVGPQWRWPWDPFPWEVRPGPDPWPDPDAAGPSAWWDPSRFAPEGPDALAVLVAFGEVPAGGPGLRPPPGLPWLPAGLTSDPPAPVPGDALGLDEVPLVEWLWARLHADPGGIGPGEPARRLLGDELRAEVELLPGVLPGLPEDLR